MQANWSLMLNIVFLGIILGMIFWRIRPYLKKDSKTPSQHSFAAENKSYQDFSDDILSVRKISRDDEVENADAENSNIMDLNDTDYVETDETPNLGLDLSKETNDTPVKKNIMIFLAAQGQNIFAGYELLQTLLSSGLRFGDGGLFHRHQHASGQGPVLFSLAAATTTGVFDLQNMGSMSMKGLCMFMELSGNSTIDHERYELFIHTAKQLAVDLGAMILDEKQKPITLTTWERFERMINQVEYV